MVYFSGFLHILEVKNFASKIIKSMVSSDLKCLCVDSIMGTPFYLMDYVKGRIFKDHRLPELPPEDRWPVFEALCDVLCKIHRVDVDKAQLSDYGRKGRNELLDERVDGWMAGWLSGWMVEWVDGWMDEWVDGWMVEWVDG